MAVCAALLASLAWASPEGTEGPAEGVGVLVRIEGRVEVLRAGSTEWLPAVPEQSLDEGEQVRTGPDGRAMLSLEDGAVVHLDPDGEIEVGELPHAGGVMEFSIRLAVGRVLAALDRALHPRSKFEIHAPTAVIAVRGTEFAVEAEPSATQTAVFEGRVGVASVGAGGEPGEAVAVGANEETMIRSRERPDRPGRLSARWEAHRTALRQAREWHRRQRARLRDIRQRVRAEWRAQRPERHEQLKALHQERREKWREWRRMGREPRPYEKRHPHPERPHGRPGPR